MIVLSSPREGGLINSIRKQSWGAMGHLSLHDGEVYKCRSRRVQPSISISKRLLNSTSPFRAKIRLKQMLKQV